MRAVWPRCDLWFNTLFNNDLQRLPEEERDFLAAASWSAAIAFILMSSTMALQVSRWPAAAARCRGLVVP